MNNGGRYLLCCVPSSCSGSSSLPAKTKERKRGTFKLVAYFGLAQLNEFIQKRLFLKNKNENGATVQDGRRNPIVAELQ